MTPEHIAKLAAAGTGWFGPMVALLTMQNQHKERVGFSVPDRPTTAFSIFATVVTVAGRCPP